MFGTGTPFPLSLTQLRRFTGKGTRYDYLETLASKDVAFEKFDFNVKALDTTNQWTVGANSTSTTWAVLAEPGGWIRGGTGTSVATGAVQISIPQKYWNGTKGAGMAALIRMSAVTEVRVECGFADVLPAVGTFCVNLPSNAFNSVTTGAVYLYNQDASNVITSGLYTIGSSTAFGSVATTTNRYASGVTLFVMLEISGRQVQMWNGNGNAPIATATNGTTAADAWIPFIQATTLGGASKNIDVDTIWTWTMGRNT